MNPKYKFELTINGDAHRVFPIYKDDLAIDAEQESGQQFFRRKLSGKLTFVADEYKMIADAAFDTKFGLEIFISYDFGNTWTSYWRGKFYKTDCDFDDDDQNVEVQPSVTDDYDDLLAGLEKEFDLIKLAPEIVPVNYDKRPMLQIYVPGQTVIGCFLSGMWWEQECDAVTNTGNLTGKFHFALNKAQRILEISGTTNPELPGVFMGVPPTISQTSPYEQFSYVSGDFRLDYRDQVVGGAGGSTRLHEWTITKISTGVVMWRRYVTNATGLQTLPYNVTLSPVAGTGATGNVQIYGHDVSVYARYITDVLSSGGDNTFEIPSDDLVPDNRNYSRVIPYNFPNTIMFSDVLSDEPTQWGIYEPGKYYVAPSSAIITDAFPIARNAWTRVSLWFLPYAFDTEIEAKWRKASVLRDAFPLDSVISVMLAQIAPDLTHEFSTDYSQFLYGQNPISGVTQRLFITPKSNVVSSGYDQPAQKAPLTFATVLNMLRDCFRCYGFIDNGKFRIEHISYFKNGGSYAGLPVIGVDLTKEKVSRSGKKWAFATSKYSFEKPEMVARYQFGWMDDVTELFEGRPIDIVSNYVEPGNVENISVSQMTSDIDYILLNPSEISKDGFVLLSPVLENGEYVLPYLNVNIDGTDHYLQNGYVSFEFLQQYYFDDMPAWVYEIGGEQYEAAGVKRLKTQEVNFPALTDPNLLQLVKTNLGDGMIKKMSVNLSSRNAKVTLAYDTTEQ